jgi:plastocyanin
MRSIRSVHPVGAGGSLLPALSALAVLLAGCASGTAATSGPVATTSVDLPLSYRFAPAAITVPAGSTVTWTNSDNFSHNVDLADDPGQPLAISPGENVTHAFPTPGLFQYICSLHPKDMKGSVLVTPG